ncbi:hypothetical protein DPMN_119192 [Dreissena polymorpha]|uniref:Uncharacterized protein n=1 Tax=Dreissena polymorpha TaxID=45954 RepID=A0A9D4JR07_DREPO|nr:hypothetical protein DPMN_119192 [Dreissena polymorpha]
MCKIAMKAFLHLQLAKMRGFLLGCRKLCLHWGYEDHVFFASTVRHRAWDIKRNQLSSRKPLQSGQVTGP